MLLTRGAAAPIFSSPSSFPLRGQLWEVCNDIGNFELKEENIFFFKEGAVSVFAYWVPGIAPGRLDEISK